MSQSSLAEGVRAHESWAEVRAHDQVIRYRRFGVGRTVLLLLGPSDHPEPLWPELLEALGTSFRLIAPDPPEPDADVAGWVADFLEGLGVPTVGILAADRFCIPVLELTLLGSDQVARIVLVADGTGDEPATGGRVAAVSTGVLETVSRQAVVPLLVVRRGQPAGEVLSLVTNFLRSGDAAPA